MSVYNPPRENVPIFDASLFSTENDGSSSQSVSSSVINITPKSITITPQALDLNVPTTFSFIKNAYGSNSALAVSVFTTASPTLQNIRQNLCELDWGSVAETNSELGNTIQIRYTTSVGIEQDFLNVWNIGSALVSPYLVKTSGSSFTINTTQNNTTTGAKGVIITATNVGNYSFSNFFTSPNALGTLYFEYTFPTPKLIIYTINNPLYFNNSLQTPNTTPTDSQFNFNIEILNNSGVLLTNPFSSTDYSTAMYVNTTTSVI